MHACTRKEEVQGWGPVTWWEQEQKSDHCGGKQTGNGRLG